MEKILDIDELAPGLYAADSSTSTIDLMIKDTHRQKHMLVPSRSNAPKAYPV